MARKTLSFLHSSVLVHPAQHAISDMSKLRERIQSPGIEPIEGVGARVFVPWATPRPMLVATIAAPPTTAAQNHTLRISGVLCGGSSRRSTTSTGARVGFA